MLSVLPSRSAHCPLRIGLSTRLIFGCPRVAVRLHQMSYLLPPAAALQQLEASHSKTRRYVSPIAARLTPPLHKLTATAPRRVRHRPTPALHGTCLPRLLPKGSSGAHKLETQKDEPETAPVRNCRRRQQRS